MQHADLLLEICREIMAKDPLLATMDAGPSRDVYGKDTKIYLEQGEWAYFRTAPRADSMTLVYYAPEDIPWLYYRIVGKCPPGYVLIAMDADTRARHAQFEGPRTVCPKGVDWMSSEFVTKRDFRGFVGWFDWDETTRHAYLDKRFPNGARAMPVSEKIQADNYKDAAAHRNLLKDLEDLGYTNFEQVMTLLKDKRSEVLQEREFQIWAEGYQATGESSDARLVGTQKGYSFHDACKRQYESEDAKSQSYWHPNYSAIWGCRLFDNEADARKSFG